MADYNKILADGLAALQKDPNEKNGAKKFLGTLKAAMSVASAVGVPFAGTATALIGLADAGISALDGNTEPIDLDKLLVARATDDLKSKGISEDDLDRIQNNK